MCIKVGITPSFHMHGNLFLSVHCGGDLFVLFYFSESDFGLRKYVQPQEPYDVCTILGISMGTMSLFGHVGPVLTLDTEWGRSVHSASICSAIPESRSSCRTGCSITERLSMISPRGHYALSITAGTIGFKSCPSMNLPFRSQRRAECRIKITKNKNKFTLHPFSALIVSSSGFIVVLSSRFGLIRVFSAG